MSDQKIILDRIDAKGKIEIIYDTTNYTWIRISIKGVRGGYTLSRYISLGKDSTLINGLLIAITLPPESINILLDCINTGIYNHKDFTNQGKILLLNAKALVDPLIHIKQLKGI